MAQPIIVLDGTMRYGSRTLTINGVAYIANNIQITRPSVEASDNKANGTPNRRRETLERPTLTAELQLATSSTAYPVFGMTFSDTFDSAVGAETFVLKPVPYEESNDPNAIQVVNIEAVGVTNSITTVSS